MKQLERLAQRVINRTDFIADKISKYLSKYGNNLEVFDYSNRFPYSSLSVSGNEFWVGTGIGYVVPNKYQRSLVRKNLDKLLQSKSKSINDKDDISYYHVDNRTYRLHQYGNKRNPWCLERMISSN